eukprot:3482647-Rhodomonas_salina.1
MPWRPCLLRRRAVPGEHQSLQRHLKPSCARDLARVPFAPRGQRPLDLRGRGRVCSGGIAG